MARVGAVGRGFGPRPLLTTIGVQGVREALPLLGRASKAVHHAQATIGHYWPLFPLISHFRALK